MNEGRCVVQKFGGTSLGSGERIRAVVSIIERTAATKSVIAVVSALSPQVKREGTTSLLLEACDAAVHSDDFETPLSLIEKIHTETVNDSVESPSHRADAITFLTDELASVRQLLAAVSVMKELSLRSKDVIMAVGERLSARILYAALIDRGIEAAWRDLSWFIPEEVQRIEPGTFEKIQRALGSTFAAMEYPVIVATGFLGLVPGGLLTTVGRGYSDFTASLISAGLGRDRVEEMQVWKEVDGVFSADPRTVPSAKLIPHLSTAEAAEITYFGAEVLHPMTMERVSREGIPVRVKNTFAPEREGTVILSEVPSPDGPVAVTSKRGVTVCMIQSNRMYEASGFLAAVFGVLRDHKIVVDLISTSEVSVSFTVNDSENLDAAVQALTHYGEMTVLPERGILALVGKGMRGSARSAATMLRTLAAGEIPVDMITEAASGINVSVVVEERHLAPALRAVHDAFFLSSEQPEQLRI